MTYPLPFGSVVAVAAEVVRVVREDAGPDRTMKGATARSHELSYHATKGYGDIANELAAAADWPEPDGQDYARMIRVPLPEVREGVVIGNTWRNEGRRVPRQVYGSSWGGEPMEADDGHLEDVRRVNVVQVALRVGKYRRACVVTVVPDDITTELRLNLKGGGTLTLPAMLVVARRETAANWAVAAELAGAFETVKAPILNADEEERT